MNIVNERVYVGIDQSFTGCGVVVLNHLGDMIEFSLTKTLPKDYPDKFARAKVISDAIKHTVEKYNDRIVSLEGLAFSSIGNATRDLAGLQFSIVLMLRYELSIQENLVTPRAVKSFAVNGRKGTVTKEDMINALPLHVKEKFTNANFKKTTGLADLADAYWIAKYSQENS